MRAQLIHPAGYALHLLSNVRRVVVRLDLSGAPEVLTVLSGRESAVRRLDSLRDAVGDAPADWFPSLTGAAWPGGANDGSSDGAEFRLAAE